MLGKEHIEPEITGKYRVGDIRHCFADITARARRSSATSRAVTLEEGLVELARGWKDRWRTTASRKREQELAARGLTV